MTTSAASGSSSRVRVHRFEVVPKAGQPDVIGQAVTRDAAALGIAPAAVRTTHVYLVQAEPALTADEERRIAEELLGDAVTEAVRIGASSAGRDEQLLEVHPLPGVMDPVAQSVQLAIADLIGRDVEVASGWRFDVSGVSDGQGKELAQRLLANPVIQRVTTEPYHPERFPVGKAHDQQVRHVTLTTLSDDALAKLSREAHLFLSLDEMKAVRDHYKGLGREPRDIELETLAQTWSEHCVHKTLKSTVEYRASGQDTIDWAGRPGVTVSGGVVKINNLLKSTVAAATHELIAGGVDWALSVFKDNSGVVALDDNYGVCIKVETHNRPSAIEPYGGAATGAGGCIRDVIGTGLGAKPIANTDVFCVADPSIKAGNGLPPGCIEPRRVLTQVVAGVRDYGNRMGIPTVSGGVYFDNRYVGNPLVFCGCVGLIPRAFVKGAARAGDRIVAIGGRTGRDGIHGATFSSAELEQNAADEFSHAVQIGNAVTEKQVLDAILAARDGEGGPLYHGMTDCGAGGFSSAIGEMGGSLGAEVHLERAPLKYAGLSYAEVWISEAQERMVLAVPEKNIAALKDICRREGVDFAELGHFGTPNAELILKYKGGEVGRISMHFLHEGIPMPTRPATWTPTAGTPSRRAENVHPKDALLKLLAHPNIASKHWIIRQYDHEVQGNTAVKPLVGPSQRGPSDASVLEPVAGSNRGIALSQGLQTGIGDPAVGGDAYWMVLAAIDECVRNLVCIGADPSRIAILDNFCWPSCDKPANMGSLVRACAACYDGAKAYGAPFVSGKDSLNNQLRYTDPATGEQRVIEIPATLLITGLGIVPRIDRVVTMDTKRAENALVVIGPRAGSDAMGGSHYQRMFGGSSPVPRVDLKTGPAAARLVAGLIQRGAVASAHDVSDGGVLSAVAEMLIGGNAAASPSAAPIVRNPRPIGAQVHLSRLGTDFAAAAFGEAPSRYVLEVEPGRVGEVLNSAGAAGIDAVEIGVLDSSGVLTDGEVNLSVVVGDLAGAWLGTLDW
ncbi:MAG TPA: AIR synthase-related protein [Phycisphaerales bacterium]|nr:AIR synthase-related protein [Phycisphaerales bacterium]